MHSQRAQVHVGWAWRLQEGRPRLRAGVLAGAAVAVTRHTCCQQAACAGFCGCIWEPPPTLPLPLPIYLTVQSFTWARETRQRSKCAPTQA